MVGQHIYFSLHQEAREAFERFENCSHLHTGKFCHWRESAAFLVPRTFLPRLHCLERSDVPWQSMSGSEERNVFNLCVAVVWVSLLLLWLTDYWTEVIPRIRQLTLGLKVWEVQDKAARTFSRSWHGTWSRMITHTHTCVSSMKYNDMSYPICTYYWYLLIIYIYT